MFYHRKNLSILWKKLESTGRHIKFFRVRTPITTGNIRGGAEWLIFSLEYLDFDYRVLLIESALIGIMTKGSFTYQDCKNMPFDIYQKLIIEIPIELKRILDND